MTNYLFSHCFAWLKGRRDPRLNCRTLVVVFLLFFPVYKLNRTIQVIIANISTIHPVITVPLAKFTTLLWQLKDFLNAAQVPYAFQPTSGIATTTLVYKTGAISLLAAVSFMVPLLLTMTITISNTAVTIRNTTSPTKYTCRKTLRSHVSSNSLKFVVYKQMTRISLKKKKKKTYEKLNTQLQRWWGIRSGGHLEFCRQ